MIFIVHVQSGKELGIVSSLKINNIVAYAPQHDIAERSKGVWREVRRIIFPGYIFIEADSITDDIYYTVRKTDGVVRFLGRPPAPLPASEEFRIKWILETEILTVSTGYIQDGKVYITNGILTGREHCILKYSKRRKRCTLYCELNGRNHYFDVSCELTRFD